jgi:hypothetical protein
MQATPESTPAPAGAAPPVVGESLVEFVRADRQRTAYILLGISILLLALCFWAAWTASKTSAAPEKKDDSPFPMETEDVKTKAPNRSEYIVGALVAGLGVLVTVGAGAFLLVSIPPPDVATQKTQARAVILGAFGLLGAVIIIGGGAFFYLWSSSLFDWLDKGQVKQAKYVIGPLLAVAIGGLLMFLAIQPARAEERDNRLLRQCIYGANLGLSVLLVFVALIVVNLVVGPQLPNKLDVTNSGMYTLSEGSKELLGRLPEPITAYAILPTGVREYDDIRRLLQLAQDKSNGNFTVKFISPVSDQTEYKSLADRFAKLKSHEVEGSTTGVLLTVGADEKRHEFIRDDEFFKREQSMDPRQRGAQTFVGEARLMKELLFLSESPEKTVVYFTQSAGELVVSPGPNEELSERATCQRLRDYLSRNNLDVKPLKFDLKEPKVPDDCAVLIVADPERQLDAPHVAAIRKYMTDPRPGGKKGKLIVLAGATFGAQKKEVLPTGLEDLLAGFNVRLDPRVVVGLPTREMDQYSAVAGFSLASRRARNPVAMALGEKAQFPSLLWRQVSAAPAGQGAPAFRAVPLLYTADRDRYTWLEDHAYAPGEFQQAVGQLQNNQAVRVAKLFSDDPRPVAVAVSEGETGRVVVVGNGIFISDAYATQAGGEPPGFDLVSGSVDWLRERPTLGIEVKPKTYVEFKFPATTDENRGLFLPLLLSVTVIAGLGMGVWMVRRRAA